MVDFRDCEGLGVGSARDSKEDRTRYASRAEEIVNELYEILKRTGGYDFALIDWEVGDQFFDPEEDSHVLMGEVRIPTCLLVIPGLILSAEMLSCLKSREGFEEFGEGRFWISNREEPFRSI